MKHLICCVVLSVCAVATPAIAARVYLKDGGVINAKRVWRDGKTVRVLVNRDSLETFNATEIDLKRTFPPRPKKAAAPAPRETPSATAPATAPASGTPQKKADAKPGIQMPKIPTLPTKLPEKSPPSIGGKDEGTIRKHKSEMREKTGD